jgi:hypothetical protein
MVGWGAWRHRLAIALETKVPGASDRRLTLRGHGQIQGRTKHWEIRDTDGEETEAPRKRGFLHSGGGRWTRSPGYSGLRLAAALSLLRRPS